MIHCASRIVLLNSLLPLEQSHLPWGSAVPAAGSLSTASGTGTVCLRKCSVTVQVHRETSCDSRLWLWLLLCRLTCVFARSRAGRSRGQLSALQGLWPWFLTEQEPRCLPHVQVWIFQKSAQELCCGCTFPQMFHSTSVLSLISPSW